MTVLIRQKLIASDCCFLRAVDVEHLYWLWYEVIHTPVNITRSIACHISHFTYRC